MSQGTIASCTPTSSIPLFPARSAPQVAYEKTMAVQTLHSATNKFCDSCNTLSEEGSPFSFLYASQGAQRLCESLEAFWGYRSAINKAITDTENDSGENGNVLDKNTNELQSQSKELVTWVREFAEEVEKASKIGQEQRERYPNEVVLSKHQELISMIKHQRDCLYMRSKKEEASNIACAVFTKYQTSSKLFSKVSKRKRWRKSAIKPKDKQDAREALSELSNDFEKLSSSIYPEHKYPTASYAQLPLGSSLSNQTTSMFNNETSSTQVVEAPDIQAKWSALLKSFQSIEGDDQILFQKRHQLRAQARSILDHGLPFTSQAGQGTC